ncbi:hypothetical protein Tco_0146549 [Tanacetum coccineum]|uniref:Uncharacterized protein n=1 Tax=Tanacetum coccineum TaxID=301880 RepID=A0ABQ4Y1K8_9ASTR
MDKECLFETKIAKKAILQETNAHKKSKIIQNKGGRNAKGEPFVQEIHCLMNFMRSLITYGQPMMLKMKGVLNGWDKEKVSTDKEKVSTDRTKVSTDDSKVLEGHSQVTQTPAAEIFKDDETIAKVLLNISQAKAVSREKEKGVELREVKDAERPRPTSQRSLYIKPSY